MIQTTQLPLRVRLALGYSLFFGMVLLLLSAGVYWFVRISLYGEVRTELTTNAELIQQDFATSAAPLLGYFSDPDTILRALPDGIQGLESPTLYVQVVAPAGDIVVTSHSLSGQQMPIDSVSFQEAMHGLTQLRELPLGNERVMLINAPLSSQGRVLGLLQVAQPLQSIDRTLEILLLGMGLLIVCALLAALRGGIWLTRLALQPVEQIAHTARQIIEAADLSQRVPEALRMDEIGELTATINAMLERIEALFVGQRRFVADVGHELRTPLTAMRGHLELLQRGVIQDAAIRDETVGDLLREVARLSRMANDLLLLAQTEVGVQLRHEPVALDELVLEVVRELQPLALRCSLRPHLHEQVAVTGDRDRLKQALLNLVANAIQHTPPGGIVTVEVGREASMAFLQVHDTGSGIAAADLPCVFERFYQADRTQARRAGGAGLGLAIVRWIAEAHHGNVTVESTPGQGATFTLHLPGNTSGQ